MPCDLLSHWQFWALALTVALLAPTAREEMANG